MKKTIIGILILATFGFSKSTEFSYKGKVCVLEGVKKTQTSQMCGSRAGSGCNIKIEYNIDCETGHTYSETNNIPYQYPASSSVTTLLNNVGTLKDDFLMDIVNKNWDEGIFYSPDPIGNDWENNPYKGNLERPILFVHGILSDMGAFGGEPPFMTCDYPSLISTRNDFDKYKTPIYLYKCKNGSTFESKLVLTDIDNVAEEFGKSQKKTNNIIGKYNKFADEVVIAREYELSAALAIANEYHVSRTYNYCGYQTACENFGINHNGLEFYTAKNRYDQPISPMDDLYGQIDSTSQVNQLYNRLREVLDEYYSDWESNPARKVDIISHSQGGIITRMLFERFKDPKIENPVNHINHIISVNTPHKGVELALPCRKIQGGVCNDDDPFRRMAFDLRKKVENDLPNEGIYVDIDLGLIASTFASLGNYLKSSVTFSGYEVINDVKIRVPLKDKMGKVFDDVMETLKMHVLYNPEGKVFDQMNNSGHPINFYDRKMIPISTIGSISEKLVPYILANFLDAMASEACKQEAKKGIISYMKQCKSDVKSELRRILDHYELTSYEMNKFSLNSDYVSSINSQIPKDIFKDGYHKKIRLPGNLVPHSSMEFGEEVIIGAPHYVDYIIDALENPKKKGNPYKWNLVETVISPLLLN